MEVQLPERGPTATIQRIIVDTETKQVRAIVLGGGGLARPVEAQLGSLAAVDGAARLTVSADELAALPTFTERAYHGAPETKREPTVGSAAAESLWPTGYAPPPAAGKATPAAAEAEVLRETAVTTERDLESAVLAAGDQVCCCEGEIVGTLAGLTFDTETGQVTDVSVRGEESGNRPLTLPASLIDRVDDHLLCLTVPLDEVPAHGK
jgi:hypothetical protein